MFTQQSRIFTGFVILLIAGLSASFSNSNSGVFKSLEAAFANPEAVIELRLRRERLEKLPENISEFKNLKVLDVRKNKLSQLPASLAKLNNLEELQLGKNRFTEIPPVVFDCTQLKTLSVSSNRIAEVPLDIQNLKKLEHLDFFDTYIEYLPTSAVQQLENLTTLDLRRTFIFSPEAKAYNEILPKVKIYSNPGCDCNNPKKKIKKEN